MHVEYRKMDFKILNQVVIWSVCLIVCTGKLKCVYREQPHVLVVVLVLLRSINLCFCKMLKHCVNFNSIQFIVINTVGSKFLWAYYECSKMIVGLKDCWRFTDTIVKVQKYYVEQKLVCNILWRLTLLVCLSIRCFKIFKQLTLDFSQL